MTPPVGVIFPPGDAVGSGRRSQDVQVSITVHIADIDRVDSVKRCDIHVFWFEYDLVTDFRVRPADDLALSAEGHDDVHPLVPIKIRDPNGHRAGACGGYVLGLPPAVQGSPVVLPPAYEVVAL